MAIAEFRCGELLPVGAFAGDRSESSGRKSICKECDRVRARDRYEERMADVPEYLRRQSDRPEYTRHG